jgi:hypothetical protein
MDEWAGQDQGTSDDDQSFRSAVDPEGSSSRGNEPVAAKIMSAMAQEKTEGAIPCSCAEEGSAMAKVSGDELLDGLRP